MESTVTHGVEVCSWSRGLLVETITHRERGLLVE